MRVAVQPVGVRSAQPEQQQGVPVPGPATRCDHWGRVSGAQTVIHYRVTTVPCPALGVAR